MKKILIVGLLLTGLVSCGTPATTPIPEAALEVIYSDTTITTSEQPQIAESPSLAPQQNLIVLTYTQNKVEWNGPETYVTNLYNGSNSTASVSQQVSASSSGTISGGLEAQGIKIAIGYTGTMTKTSTVTVNNVPPRSSVKVNSRPIGYKYFGYQRLAPVGVTWEWCNKNPQNCPQMKPWTATNVTGIGFVTR